MEEFISAPESKLFSADDPVFIVAGGPSLLEVDLSPLHGRQTIAVNLSYRLLPNASAIYFSDRRFWSWHGEEMAAHGSPLYSGKWPKASFIDDAPVTYFIFKGREGFEPFAPLIAHGNNSGYAAINVAYHLGAREVVLLGFDMARGKSGRSHWHGGHAVKPSKDSSWSKMLPAFETLSLPAKAAGLKIWNATEGSKIPGDQIPRRRLAEFV
jgi:hypothetical protein